MKTIYGLIADNGDGFNSIHWYTNKELVDYLLENDESYYSNGNKPAAILNIPNNLDLKAIGFLSINNQSIDEWRRF